MAENETVESPSSGKGPGKIRPEDNPKPFTSENQPDVENVKKGQRRYYATRDLLRTVVGKLPGTPKDLIKKIAAAYGVSEKDVDVNMIMDFQQIQKAVQEKDTQAYKAVKVFAFGRPAEEQPLVIDQKTDEKNEIVLPGGIKLVI